MISISVNMPAVSAASSRARWTGSLTSATTWFGTTNVYPRKAPKMSIRSAIRKLIKQLVSTMTGMAPSAARSI